MKTNYTKNADKLVVCVEGRIDTTTSPDLDEELSQLLTYEVKDFTLDLEKVEYVSSAGLRVVFKAFQKMVALQGKMRVVHTSEEVRKVFEMVGFEKVLDIS